MKLSTPAARQMDAKDRTTKDYSILVDEMTDFATTEQRSLLSVIYKAI